LHEMDLNYQMRRLFTLIFMSAWGVSCSGMGTTDPQDMCQPVALPLTGSPAGPTVTDVALEPQAGEGIIALATATDPQGSENMLDVLQTIGVFPDAGCEGSPIPIQDDLACSGCEESFGIVVGASANPALFDAIAAAVTWPVTVEFSDLDGNRTSGQVLARIAR
jgi:hypothetical protein